MRPGARGAGLVALVGAVALATLLLIDPVPPAPAESSSRPFDGPLSTVTDDDDDTSRLGAATVHRERVGAFRGAVEGGVRKDGGDVDQDGEQQVRVWQKVKEMESENEYQPHQKQDIEESQESVDTSDPSREQVDSDSESHLPLEQVGEQSDDRSLQKQQEPESESPRDEQVVVDNVGVPHQNHEKDGDDVHVQQVSKTMDADSDEESQQLQVQDVEEEDEREGESEQLHVQEVSQSSAIHGESHPAAEREELSQPPREPVIEEQGVNDESDESLPPQEQVEPDKQDKDDAQSPRMPPQETDSDPPQMENVNVEQSFPEQITGDEEDAPEGNYFEGQLHQQQSESEQASRNRSETEQQAPRTLGGKMTTSGSSSPTATPRLPLPVSKPTGHTLPQRMCTGYVQGRWEGDVFLPSSNCSYRILPLRRGDAPDPVLLPSCLRGKTVLFLGSSHSRNHFRCMVDVISNGRSAHYNTQWPRAARVQRPTASRVAGLSLCENVQGDHRSDLVWYDAESDVEVTFLWAPTYSWRGTGCSERKCVDANAGRINASACQGKCPDNLPYLTWRTLPAVADKFVRTHHRRVDFMFVSLTFGSDAPEFLQFVDAFKNRTKVYVINTHGNQQMRHHPWRYWFFSSMPAEFILRGHLQTQALVVSTLMLIDHMVAATCPSKRALIGVDVVDYVQQNGVRFPRSFRRMTDTKEYALLFPIYGYKDEPEVMLENMVQVTGMDSDEYFASLNEAGAEISERSHARYATLWEQSNTIDLAG
jgi:hypothetical protein